MILQEGDTNPQIPSRNCCMGVMADLELTVIHNSHDDEADAMGFMERHKQHHQRWFGEFRARLLLACFMGFEFQTLGNLICTLFLTSVRLPRFMESIGGLFQVLGVAGALLAFMMALDHSPYTFRIQLGFWIYLAANGVYLLVGLILQFVFEPHESAWVGLGMMIMSILINLFPLICI